ncbi:hypothetical protein [Streptomyces olivaceus]|uniref:hypothetical protein n=1 Tax=Streptomyces olivaceus TaxID=47716 RepID=UPI003684B925
MIDDRDEVTQSIIGALEPLSLRQLHTVESVVKGLHIPVQFIPGPATSMVDTPFAEEMSTLLSIHHSNHEAPLNKKPFEYALKRCLVAQGHPESELNPAPGESAYDVFGDNQRWSLKTEAAKRLSPTQVRIEKFSEARWVREATTPELCATGVKERIIPHMEGYDRILLLRAETRTDRFVYALEEIPKSILVDCLTSVTSTSFSKKDRGSKPGVSFGADFMHPEIPEKAFRMLLDSSAEKIRVWFQTKYCIHHGTWVVERPESDDLTLFTPR